MKTPIYLIALLLTLLVMEAGVTYASFPVKKAQETEKSNSSDIKQDKALGEDGSVVIKAVEKGAKSNKSTKESNGMAADDELITTFLLWLFLGGFAAHRWYKKKPTGWNILFILTGGGCGIWAIVDLVKILNNDF